MPTFFRRLAKTMSNTPRADRQRTCGRRRSCAAPRCLAQRPNLRTAAGTPSSRRPCLGLRPRRRRRGSSGDPTSLDLAARLAGLARLARLALALAEHAGASHLGEVLAVLAPAVRPTLGDLPPCLSASDLSAALRRAGRATLARRHITQDGQPLLLPQAFNLLRRKVPKTASLLSRHPWGFCRLLRLLLLLLVGPPLAQWHRPHCKPSPRRRSGFLKRC